METLKLFNPENCNYNVYEQILTHIKSTGRYMDFSEAIDSEFYIVIRHDIEFSIDRAYQMARLEQKNNISSSYLVQITNNSYNALSKKNIDLLKEMISMGHKIGLHYHRNHLDDIEQMKYEIIEQSLILEKFLSTKVDRFSFHRPTPDQLNANIEVEGMINTYSPKFFTLKNDEAEILSHQPKYIADSNHQWKYGLPTTEYFAKYNKIQLLVHPMSWTPKGETHLECFVDLKKEKGTEFIETIENEWKIFDLIRGKI